jgi:hypothetical protein
MTKQILTALLLLTVFCVGHVAGQKTDAKSKGAKPDFTGTWFWKMGNNDKWFHQMSIVQSESEIKISERVSFPDQIETESTYFLDGRGEKNQSPDGKISESLTNWKENKLIMTFYQTNAGTGEKIILGTIEYSLKKNKLIIKKKSADRNQAGVDIILSQNEREFIRLK